MIGLAARKLAIEILLKVEKNGAFAGAALVATFKNHSLSERDRAFVTYLVQGTLRHQTELDEEIKKFSKKPLERLTPNLRAVLRCAFFQLLYMDDMPAPAVINTSVEVARKTGHEGHASFVNAILRSFLRLRQNQDNKAEPEPLAPADQNKPKIAPDGLNLSRRYSLPEWITERWLSRFGEEECLQILEHSQEIPCLTLRTCLVSITCEGLLDILQNKGMTVVRSALMPACLKIIDRGKCGGPVSKLPGYSEGLFAVQDDASALVSVIVSPQPGQVVVDLCAAPGGKSVHLGELMENRGRVIAVDSNEKRLSLLAAERRRLGLSNIETVISDARTYRPEVLCDAVLIDAPCSGTGVMNRRSDLRQHRQAGHINSLVEIQKAILENAAAMIKADGVLVYSTCSLEPEENEQNMSWFLEEHPEYEPDDLEPFFSTEILDLWSGQAHFPETRKQLNNGYIQLLPSRHGSSGFFISRLRRRS